MNTHTGVVTNAKECIGLIISTATVKLIGMTSLIICTFLCACVVPTDQ